MFRSRTLQFATRRSLFSSLMNKTPTAPARTITTTTKPVIPRLPYSDAPMFSSKWWFDFSIIMLVFALSGSCTVKIVRPFLNSVGVQGSFSEGPWMFRICYLSCTIPFHSFLLVVFGTILGKGQWFRASTLRMWSRLLPSPVVARLAANTAIKKQ